MNSNDKSVYLKTQSIVAVKVTIAQNAAITNRLTKNRQLRTADESTFCVSHEKLSTGEHFSC